MYTSWIFCLVICNTFIFIYSDDSLMKSNGENVCSRQEAYTQNVVKTFYKGNTVQYETCCRKIIWCAKKCYKTRLVTQAFTKMVTVAKLRTIYFCCKGWEKSRKGDHGCTKAICRPECVFGKCVRPNTCEYNSASTNVKTIINEAKCGGTISNMESGTVSLYGNNHNPLLTTELCRWDVRIPEKLDGDKPTAVRINFEEFKMSNETACAESMVSLRTRALHVFFFCSAIFPEENQTFLVKDREFVIEAIRSNWKKDDGFSLRFEREENPE